MDITETRRHFLAMGGFGLAATATIGAATIGATTASATDSTHPSEAEQANIRLVEDFIRAFSDPKADFATLMDKYVAPNASVRWSDSQPAVYGPKAALDQLMAHYPKNATFSINIREIFAHGPLVSTYRVDTMSMPGHKDFSAAVAGVCVVKGGKIVEYCDYIIV